MIHTCFYIKFYFSKTWTCLINYLTDTRRDLRKFIRFRWYFFVFFSKQVSTRTALNILSGLFPALMEQVQKIQNRLLSIVSIFARFICLIVDMRPATWKRSLAWILNFYVDKIQSIKLIRKVANCFKCSKFKGKTILA